MNKLDRIEMLLALAARADEQGPIPYAFVATPVVEAMTELLPLLMAFARHVTLNPMPLDALDRRDAAIEALLAYLGADPKDESIP